MPKGRVLSIQSYVASGYVGNRVSTLILEVLGFEVDVINSINWSNQPGHSKFYGTTANKQEFEDLYLGLKENNLNYYDYVISGFCGNESFLEYLYDVIIDLKVKNKNIKFFLDPVLGDFGRFYCPKSFVNIYKSKLLLLADVITPNQFEAEHLSDIKIESKNDSIKACYVLHSFGPKIVIISSIEIPEFGTDNLTCVISYIEQTINNDSQKIVFLTFPKYNSKLIGTGDAFTSLLLSNIHLLKSSYTFDDLINCVICSLSTMQQIIKKSLDELVLKSKYIPNGYKFTELSIVDCIQIILDHKIEKNLFKIS